MINVLYLFNNKIKITSTKNIHRKKITYKIHIHQKTPLYNHKLQMLIFLTNKCIIHNKTQMLRQCIGIYSVLWMYYTDKIYSTKPTSCCKSIFLRKRYRFISTLRTEILNKGAISFEERFKRK